MFRKALLGALTATAFALPAAAQDAYVVGLTGALTGPPASTYAPAVEALRIYIDRVNAAGGVNGKKIKLVIEDDGAQPSKAAANAKKLITQDNVVLMVNASLSSTYAPVVAEAKRAGRAAAVRERACARKERLSAGRSAAVLHHRLSPPTYDSQAALDFIKATAKEPVKIGFSAMAIPLSRGEIDFRRGAVEDDRHGRRWTRRSSRRRPPTTRRSRPSSRMPAPTGSISWAPWVTQVRTLEALRRLGWKGDYIAWAHIEAEGELARLKDGKFYVVGANALFQDDLPIHKEIADAAKKAGVEISGADQMTEGWIGGMVIEAALKATAGRPTAPSCAARWRTSRSTPRACAAGRSSGPRTTTSARSTTTASTSGTAARSRACRTGRPTT